MSSSTTKRVVLYRFDRQPLEGFVNPHAYLHETNVELLTLQGSIQRSNYSDIKALCFSSESGDEGLFSEENLFKRRPKVPGLWTRFTFRDGDQLDGILSHNLMEWPTHGYLVTPPRASSARQRVFIPRVALLHTELRGVVGRSNAATVKATGRRSQDQIEMFGDL